jgi:hypothetical protein
VTTPTLSDETTSDGLSRHQDRVIAHADRPLGTLAAIHWIEGNNDGQIRCLIWITLDEIELTCVSGSICKIPTMTSSNGAAVAEVHPGACKIVGLPSSSLFI